MLIIQESRNIEDSQGEPKQVPEMRYRISRLHGYVLSVVISLLLWVGIAMLSHALLSRGATG